jgi:predicted amidophosphoribosyltransferase
MNCQYCGSKIFEDDRTCERCGAPNLSVKFVEKDTFGEWMQMIEMFSPEDYSYSENTIVEGIGNQLLYKYYHNQ